MIFSIKKFEMVHSIVSTWFLPKKSVIFKIFEFLFKLQLKHPIMLNHLLSFVSTVTRCIVDENPIFIPFQNDSEYLNDLI